MPNQIQMQMLCDICPRKVIGCRDTVMASLASQAAITMSKAHTSPLSHTMMTPLHQLKTVLLWQTEQRRQHQGQPLCQALSTLKQATTPQSFSFMVPSLMIECLMQYSMWPLDSRWTRLTWSLKCAQTLVLQHRPEFEPLYNCPSSLQILRSSTTCDSA